MPDEVPVTQFKYPDAKRKHIPPSGEMATNKVREEAKVKFAYDPHRTPTLQFNEQITRCRELLQKSTRTILQSEEAEELVQMLESEQPWLEWAGKREQAHFEVDPVALHIHERVSAQAILNTVRREDIQRDFFAEPQLPAREARAYYQYDVDWANRIILGDSLQVMTSLARREGLAGQVQMIYLDPPYGVSFKSNWQNEVGKRDVKDKDEDLTREPEMIRAYRDTWTLGVHSYLAYLKQRLIIARELLTDSGSIFVQISEENMHRVRAVLDEVFGAENHVATITLTKTTGAGSPEIGTLTLPSICDYIVWYSRDSEKLNYHPLHKDKVAGEEGATRYRPLPNDPGKLATTSDIRSQSGGPTAEFPIQFQGVSFRPQPLFWKTNQEGVRRLNAAERFFIEGKTLRFLRLFDDYPASPLTNVWTDVGGIQSRSDPKVYVVQTATKIVERCMLMTTAPGDLVLDPTCGSGTTAFVAEHWGRRWITIDSSRVAAAIARQRLLTALFDTYKTKDPEAGVDPNQPLNPKHGFYYKTIPHVTLKSIAQNKGLDPIFARHEPVLAELLVTLNASLAGVTDTLRQQLVGKLIKKLRDQGTRSVSDADKRRWLLPATNPELVQQLKGGPTATQVRDLRAAIPPDAAWREWEVPFDTDGDWPTPLQEALTAYRAAWREKMDEVDDAIAKNADPEDLVDQPELLRGVVRVSGPFTVESIRPSENSPEPETVGGSPMAGAPDELPTFEGNEVAATNAANHIDRMLSLLRQDGITFLGNRHVKLDPLERIESSFLHAAGEYTDENAKKVSVAIAIGPEIGSVPVFQVEETMRLAYRKGYDLLVIAAFSFDAAAQEAIQSNNDDTNSKLRIEMAQIRPDVTMGDLLKKTQVTAQIFTVFGQPRSTLTEAKDGTCTVTVEGVDIYDPVKNSIEATSASKVAAWFLDTDYDGKVFCICQAFFPDKSAWEKLNRALKGSIEEGAFEALSGTTSIPFKIGERKTVAVKVIDPRGNEVMKVHRIGRASYG